MRARSVIEAEVSPREWLKSKPIYDYRFYLGDREGFELAFTITTPGDANKAVELAREYFETLPDEAAMEQTPALTKAGAVLLFPSAADITTDDIGDVSPHEPSS